MHFLDQIADCPGVDLPAELLLGFDLVALGDGDIAHVVSEAHDLHAFRHRHADGGLHPAADAGLHILVLPVARDDLAGLAKARADEAMLAVAVRGLIEVHEIHVDLIVGNFAVVLGCKVQPRLLQKVETVDPHFRRRERVAPRHDAGAGIVIVCFLYDLRDLGAGFGRDLIPEGIRKDGGQLLRHFLGAACNRCQNLLAVERLRADNEPEFIVFHDITSLKCSDRCLFGLERCAEPRQILVEAHLVFCVRRKRRALHIRKDLLGEIRLQALSAFLL